MSVNKKFWSNQKSFYSFGEYFSIDENFLNPEITSKILQKLQFFVLLIRYCQFLT
jgi:hypothetical protein